METIEKARFDTRLPKEQKESFEYAARLGGFRTLTEFVIFSVQKYANKIIEDHDTILASKRDREIFFDAVMNPQEPGDNLIKAASRYREAVDK